MIKKMTEHIYGKKDIDKAFDMGIDTAVSAFERTIGMSPDSQRLILHQIKDILLKNKAKLRIGTCGGSGRITSQAYPESQE